VRTLLLVALGGAAGSVLRWALASAIQRGAGTAFPWGTFAVNVTGAFAIGVLAAIAIERATLPPATRDLLLPGLLGGFTTFSALSLETFALLRDGHWAAAAVYALGSLIAGLAATVAGFALGMRL
jgi:CrcB protein